MDLRQHMVYLVLLSTVVSSAALAMPKSSISKDRAHAGVRTGASRSTECERSDAETRHGKGLERRVTHGCPYDAHSEFSVCRDERRKSRETFAWTNRSAEDHKALRDSSENSPSSSLMQILNQTVSQVHTLAEATWASTPGKWIMFGINKVDDANSKQPITEISHWLCRMRALEIPAILVCLHDGCADKLHGSVPDEWKHSVLDLSKDFQYWKNILSDDKSYAFVISLALVELGYDNFYSDLDTYWNVNPYPVLQSLVGEVVHAPQIDLGDAETRRHFEAPKDNPVDCTPGCMYLSYESLMWDVRGGIVERGGPEGLGRSEGDVSSSGLRFYKATEGARIALRETLLRGTIKYQLPGQSREDQGVTHMAIKPLCGVEVNCSIFPASFSQSNWEAGIHFEGEVLHLIIEDKVFWRYLTASLEDKGPASKDCACSAEYKALQDFIVRKPSCHRSLTQSLGLRQMADLAKQMILGSHVEDDSERLSLQEGMGRVGCNATAQHSPHSIHQAWCKPLSEEVPGLLHLLPPPEDTPLARFDERRWRRIFAAALVCSVPPWKYLDGSDF